MSPGPEVPELVEEMAPEPKHVVNMISVGRGPDQWVTVWGIDSLEETWTVFLRVLEKMKADEAEDTKKQTRSPDVG